MVERESFRDSVNVRDLPDSYLVQVPLICSAFSAVKDIRRSFGLRGKGNLEIWRKCCRKMFTLANVAVPLRTPCIQTTLCCSPQAPNTLL